MTGKFQFRLQKVLEYKEEMEKQAQLKLVEKELALKTLADRLAALRKELNQLQEEQKNNSETRINLHETIISCRYTDFLGGCIKNQQDRIAYAETEVKNSRESVKEAAKERKTLDVLKESKYKVFSQEIKKTEQKLNDEFALNSYYRHNKAVKNS